MTSIFTRRPDHAGIYYLILSELDLGRDAANLFRPDLVDLSGLSESVRQRLLTTYLKTPNRIIAQILPLLVNEGPAFKRLLARGVPPLSDPCGKELLAQLLDAIEIVEPNFRPADSRDVSSLVTRLDDLRSHLWAPDRSPPLELWDCPALLVGTGTRARATQRKDRHIIALSFDALDEEFLIQVLHEDTHPLTDPPIRAGFEGVSQDTQAGSVGFQLHRALETAVVERNQELFEEHAKDLLEPYMRWRRRMSI